MGSQPTHRCATPRAGQREELCRILLDEFRRELAVDVDCLTEDGFDRSSGSPISTCVGSWSIPRTRASTAAGMVSTRVRHARAAPRPMPA